MGVEAPARGRSPSSSMRTLSLGLLTVQFSAFILLLHYSRVMTTPDGHRYLPSTAVFLVELLKLAICATISFYEISMSAPHSTTISSLLSVYANAVFAGDSWKMAIPACLYTLANSLQYVGISNLDAATFQVVYQFKIIVTAVLSVVLLRRSLASRQWVSLLLLMIGVATVSSPGRDGGSLASSHHARIYIPRSTSPFRDLFRMTQPGSHLRKRSATYEGIEEDERALYSPAMDASVGVLAVICVCICSGLAGVYFEKVIKSAHQGTSLWIRNVQLSLYSLFPAFFIGVVFLDGEFVAKHGFFAGYNWVVWLSILIQSVGGIVAAFCIFHADNISKNFAVSISMVLSSLASVVFFGFHATTNFLIGTTVVLVATWLYNTEDSGNGRPPPIKINGVMEKPSISNPTEANDVSIQIPKTPLSLEETAMATSRPGSPTRKKRKNEIGYFTKPHE